MGVDGGCDGRPVSGVCLPTRKVTGVCASPLTISVETFPVLSHRFSSGYLPRGALEKGQDKDRVGEQTGKEQ